jgi:hypothetical protein
MQSLRCVLDLERAKVLIDHLPNDLVVLHGWAGAQQSVNESARREGCGSTATTGDGKRVGPELGGSQASQQRLTSASSSIQLAHSPIQIHRIACQHVTHVAEYASVRISSCKSCMKVIFLASTIRGHIRILTGKVSFTYHFDFSGPHSHCFPVSLAL